MPKVAYVRWFDSNMYAGGEFDLDEVGQFAEMESVGFVVKEDKVSITLALDHSLSSDRLRMLICIPKVNVRSIRRFGK
jgi:hypothetical protein